MLTGLSVVKIFQDLDQATEIALMNVYKMHGAALLLLPKDLSKNGKHLYCFYV